MSISIRSRLRPMSTYTKVQTEAHEFLPGDEIAGKANLL